MRHLFWVGVVTGALGVALGQGCYRPQPADSAFTCSPDLGGLCPAGLVCSPQGFCVQTITHDGGATALDLSGDQATVPHLRSCDERVQAGAFSNLTPLSPANTAADEEHIALDPSMTAPRLFFQRGNSLFCASISTSDPKSISAPVSVTLTGGPANLHGGSFTTDGKFWFSGSDSTGAGLYAGTPSGSATFTVAAARQPISTGCPYSDPWFMQGDSTFQLYAGFPLAGCSGDSYVVRGALDRNAGAFYSALPESGWAAPSMTSSGLLLIVSSTIGGRHLYAASRTDFQYLFASAGRIDLSGSIGEAIEDRQAVVSSDCKTIYFSSVRTGGAGGADLYAADIAAE
jgi:hypothetical protein